MWVPVEAKKGFGSPGAEEVTGSCKLPDRSKKQTQFFPEDEGMLTTAGQCLSSPAVST